MKRGARAVPVLGQHCFPPDCCLLWRLLVELLSPTPKALSNVLLCGASATRQQFCPVADMLGRGEGDSRPSRAGNPGRHTPLRRAGARRPRPSGETGA